jgi:hypothetical protein
MTYAEVVKVFLAKILEIFLSNPKRREPGDGSDGYCDCIGLIIGAIRRMGLKWTGIHGSNWAARKEITNLKPISSQSELQEGDIVLKAVAKGKSGWDLPSRYREGGKYYNGDLTDYYHAGVVYSTNPFQIRHMSKKMTIDTKVNTYYPWTHFGKSTILIKAAGGVTPQPVPTSGTQAVLVAPSGGTVNLRKEPSLKARILKQIKLGTIVNIVSPGEEWCKVTYGNLTGYMMAKFLDIIGDGKGKY